MRVCLKLCIVVITVFSAMTLHAQKMDNTFLYEHHHRLSHWWSVNGQMVSQIGYGDVKWQTVGGRAALRLRANGWFSVEAGALFTYAYHMRTYREKELRTHQSLFMKAPGPKRLKFNHELRLEQRYFKYDPIDVSTNSSRVIYRFEPRLILSGNHLEADKGVWFADGLAAFNFNMKSELAYNDFFQRATLGAGVGYGLSRQLELLLMVARQFGRTKPYYYGEEHGVNAISVTLRRALRSIP